MADTSATIIAASLDSNALEKSINKLVETVATKTKAMADNFTSEIARMEQAVRNLGNVRVNSNGSADGGSSRRTSSLKQEEQQVKSVATSYDGLAKAQQTAIGSRGGSALKKDIDEAANSYSGLIKQIERTQAKFDISPIQNLRMQQHELEAGMQTAANEAAKAKKDVDELNSAISNYRKTLETLPKNQQGFANRQAIQKEINDLITLRDASVSEQQKWTNAGRVLATQYESVKGEIKQIGQALIDSEKVEKQVTSELDKQLQRVKEINSSKSAKAAYESISAMPTNTIDQVEAKLQALQALKERVANTPLLSKSSQSQLVQTITDTKGRIEQIEMAVRRTNQSKKSLDELNAAVIQNTRREEERRNAILQTGIAAQEAFAKIRQSTQIQLADNTDKPIMGVKELTEAIRNMERAYWGMDSVNRESPLGQSLQRDIENAQKLRTAIEAYNKTLLGLPVIQDKSGIDKTLGSYTELSALLKTLSDEYRHLGREERNAAKGNDLADKIQRLGRETQKIQQQMNRPINLDAALKGSEKTIDDITYKIRRLQSYKVGIDLTNPNAANEIKQVDEAIVRLQKDMDKYLGKSKDILQSNNALGRSWNYMKNRLAFYFTVGASTSFIKNLIEVRSQYEMNERALGILINSAERGTQIFNELSQMALVSPYTLIELSAAAKQLTAYDIAARDVVDTTRRLADMASAVGVPIERLTYALGQIKAYGYLNSRDARMFANAGIPLVKQLSDYYTELEGKMVSTADVYDRMKKKAIDYNSVMAVVTKMTDEGGKFFDFQAKMADTLKVRLANLTLAWNNMLNDMGKETQGVLTFGIGALRELFLHWRQLDNAIRDAAWILGLRTGFMLIAYAALKAGNAMGVTSKQMALSSVVGTRLAGVLRTLGQSIATIVKSPLTWWSLLALAAWDIFDAFVNANKATEDFNKSLRDSAKTTYEDLKKFSEQYKNIRESLYKAETIGNLGGKETTVTTPQNIEEGEAKKVWEAMREQIELSSHASDEYISKLLSIENVSERLRQGFQILDDIQTVSAALKEIGEDGIKVTQGWAAWWNALQGADGLIGNMKDVANAEKELIENFGSVEAAKQRGSILYSDYEKRELENFRKDLKVTTDSVLDFINLNGWSGDTGKIDEVFKQVTDKLATQGNLDPQTAFTLQREVEVARAKAAREALEIRIADENNALATASDEISRQQIQKNLETLEQQKRDFDKFNGENRAYWNDFTKYIKERHISELTAAYNSMTDHGKKAMDFQSEEWQKRVHDWANRYEKSHNLATDSVFNRLRNWINDANTWSVFIKMTISTEDGKSVYKQLEEYDMAADDAWKTMQRLDKRISQLRKKGAKEVEGAETGAIDLSRVSVEDKELTQALKERTQAQKDYNDAVEKGGESKKENAAASKAQKQAESELAKALKDELKLIETVRGSYKELTKEGASHTDAVEKSVSGYEKSVANINKVLEKYGIKLDLTKFAGIANPHELQEMFKQQLNALAGKAKPTDIQAIEVELQKVNLDVEKYDLTKITKGLNNELDRLKEEYELAVSLDADPELGNMFADMMGINTETLPRTIEEYASEYTKLLNKYLSEKNAGIELPNLNMTKDDMRTFEEMVKQGTLNEEVYKTIAAAVQDVRDKRKKDMDEAIKSWDKLIEKYGEYEAKVNAIRDDAASERGTFVNQYGTEEQKSVAVRLVSDIKATKDTEEKQKLIEQLKALVTEIAGNDAARLELKVAIDKSEIERGGKAAFEDFQKSPMWSAATGDLTGMTNSALKLLADDIERFKKSSKGLTGKQIRDINKALININKERKKDNPFLSMAISIDNAKERMSVFDEQIKETEDSIRSLEGSRNQSNTSETSSEIAKLTEKLKKLKEAREKAGELDATEIVANINSMVSAVGTGVQVINDLLNAMNGSEWNEAQEVMNDTFSVLEQGGQMAALGAQIGSGYGAIIGAVVGIGMGIATAFSDNWDKKVTAKIKDSELAVKQLEVAYVDLEQAIEKAYGTATIGAKQTALANKKLQLEEIKRQIVLEKSRESKYRDNEKIANLQKEYKELFYEIQNGYTEIVDDLMGTDAAGFAENLVSSMIEAFKQGEDYMKVFEESFDKMVDNMIMKSIVSRVVSQYLDAIWEDIDKHINERTKEESEDFAKAQNEAVRRAELSNDEAKQEIAYLRSNGWGEYLAAYVSVTQKDIDDYKKAAQEEEKAAQARLKAASAFTGSDVDYIMERVTEVMPELGQKLKDILGEYYKFGESSETQLSALQQGIKGITEDTAGALEGYMNIVSQQVFLHSELLTQIRDVLVGGDGDIQLGVQAQMLLQLQQSYQVQMAIQGILEGWSTPSGMGVRVELIS